MADDHQEISEVSREKIFDALTSEAGSYYNMIYGLASALLGGSLLLIEKLITQVHWASIVFLLAPGWLVLAGAIFNILLIRERNIKSGNEALKLDFDAAEKYDKINQEMMDITKWLIGLGLLFLIAFGITNLLNR